MHQYSVQTLVVVIILICYIFTSHVSQMKKIPFLHESVVAIGLGAIFGLVFVLVMHNDIEFSDEIFFTFILPPIIFAAGYNLRKLYFFENIGIICFLGAIGTLLCFIVLCTLIGVVDHFIFGQILSTKEVMLLSSVLCATDTVAALSLIKQQTFPVLNAVLFGEGIINDAVAIILFNTINKISFEDKQSIGIGTVLLIIGDFFYLLSMSLLIGLIFGFGLSYFLKKSQSFIRYPIKQTSLIMLTGYLSYLVSQLFNLSGIISLFTSSVIMGHYCYLNISEESQKGTVVAFETVGYLSQAFVFVYLGVCIFAIKGYWLAIGLAFIILIVLPIARAVSVYVLPLCYKVVRRQFPLKSKQIKVCWYSGLIRGAIAFALCLQIQSPQSSFIKTVTLVIVLITTIFGSVLLNSFLKWIGIVSSVEQDFQFLNQSKDAQIKQNTESDRQQIKSDHVPSKYSEIGQVQKPIELIQTNSRWQKFQEQYIKPTFIKVEKRNSTTRQSQHSITNFDDKNQIS